MAGKTDSLDFSLSTFNPPSLLRMEEVKIFHHCSLAIFAQNHSRKIGKCLLVAFFSFDTFHSQVFLAAAHPPILCQHQCCLSHLCVSASAPRSLRAPPSSIEGSHSRAFLSNSAVSGDFKYWLRRSSLTRGWGGCCELDPRELGWSIFQRNSHNAVGGVKK